ncbi:hypothetical protein [Anaerotruncus colihominis]|uniref:hypothetical protein n=1 Tax=Anaerotruncus colihominis TaxID=169435 RepID=UPI0026EFC314|nr:hypothetical protein [Anaerotruncus colihominis]
MNHFPARAVSLILAVLLLLLAAGISFAAVLSGTRVYAEEGSSSAQTSAEPESAPPKTSAPDIIFASSSTSGGRLTAPADKIDDSTPDNERSSSEPSSSQTSSDDSPDDAIADIQSLTFFNSNGAPVSEVQPNTRITMKVEISDEGVSRDEFLAIRERVRANINRDTFQPDESNGPGYTIEQVNTWKKTGVKYTITYTGLLYTGETDKLLLVVNYGMVGTNEIARSFRRDNIEDLIVRDKTSRDDRYDDDDDDDESSSRPEIAPPTPTIIVSEYDYGGGNVTAASKFNLKMRFTNTSKKLPVDNIVVKLTMPEALTLTSSSNTFYIEKMSRESSVERTIGISVKPNAEPVSQAIKLSFTYEAVIDEERKQLTAEQEISIPVSQLNRFSVDPVEVPSEIYVGDDTNLEVNFVNKGKTPVYNVTAEISGNISQPGQRQFIGNVEEGKEDSASFTLGATESGEISGEILITYEDANMNVSEIRQPFTTTAVSYDEPADDSMMTSGMPSEDQPVVTPWYQTVPVWAWMVGGVVLVIFLAFIIKLLRARQKEESLLEEEDEDF